MKDETTNKKPLEMLDDPNVTLNNNDQEETKEAPAPPDIIIEN